MKWLAFSQLKRYRKYYRIFSFFADKYCLPNNLIGQQILFKMGTNESKQSTKLCNTDLEFLKSNTNYDTKTIKQKYRGFQYACPSGCLTAGKFCQMYEKHFPGGNSEKYCNLVFKTFDTDQNGFIDFKEFVLASYKQETGDNEAKLKLAFDMYDMDKNGIVDLQEMANCVEAIYDMVGNKSRRPQESSEERAKHIFGRMDKNGDGGLSRQEFIEGCLKDEELSKILVPK